MNGMTDKPTPDSTIMCEDSLREERSYNLENEILPSETRVIDRMLERTLELEGAYADSCAKLGADMRAIRVLFSLVLSCAAFRTPDSIDNVRRDARRLGEVNADIAKHAVRLARVLQERTRVQDRSSLCSGTRSHICDLIDDASQDNGFYNSWLKERLSVLRGQFDMKYWPNVEQIVTAIGEDAGRAQIAPIGDMAEVAVQSPRPSKASFLRILFRKIEDAKGDDDGGLPSNFHLRDETYAALTSVSLDLDDMIDGPFVKRLRQQDREMR
ncbi:MAG: hypothetical protein AAGE03_00985 [Pseudomonadota bacterium]